MIKPKHLFNEIGRLQALNELLIANSSPDVRFDRIVEYAANYFEMPIAAIHMIGEESTWFKAVKGLPSNTEFPREITFCSHAIVNDEIMVVSDANIDIRFHDNPIVQDFPNIAFYAGAPLKLPSGFIIGALCIIDNKPRQLNESDLNLLACLRNLVVHELLQLDTSAEEINANKPLTSEVFNFIELLGRHNLHTALTYLNSRTPHRYTAIYQFKEQLLKNVCLVDKYNPSVKQGQDAHIENSYCAALPSALSLDMLSHIPESYLRVPSPVEAYGGVLITDDDGNPFGSLCHFDYRRCEVNRNDIPLLRKAAPLIYSYLSSNNNR